MTTEADLVFRVFKQGLVRGGMGVMTLITFPLCYRQMGVFGLE